MGLPGYILFRAVALATSALIPGTVWAQAVPAETANQARIDKLLSQMSLEEKMNLIRGAVEPAATNQGQAGFLPGVPRLGVPSLRMADGPPGLLTRVPGQAETATMGVAATWSRPIAQQNGVVIGREARALGIDVVLQPFINIDRDLNFARGYNTFGEDPYLSGQMGAAEVRGAQSQHIMAQAKHYVGYDTDAYNVRIDPQALHEVYVAPFEEVVKAGVSSIMCSYNRINGPFACDNADTQQKILKGELGFKGFITSDWVRCTVPSSSITAWTWRCPALRIQKVPSPDSSRHISGRRRTKRSLRTSQTCRPWLACSAAPYQKSAPPQA